VTNNKVIEAQRSEKMLTSPVIGNGERLACFVVVSVIGNCYAGE
jgi:hypothetical protein